MMTEEDRDECHAALASMEMVANWLYPKTAQTGVHTFIEFCGLINEYISICRASLEAGIDFRMASRHSGRALEMRPHHARYLAEKLSCIYGPSLSQGPLREAFLNGFLTEVTIKPGGPHAG